ncbi:MAG: molybdopterin dinucleotide binding domain-containing protein [Candidatus Bathyarchaeia archaeon]
MARLKMTLLTGRTINQGVGKELGKFSKEYEESVAVCELDPEDLKLLEINIGESILVKSEFGSVILRASESKRAPHRGVAYVPYGLWANLLTGVETAGTGMPYFKGLPVEVEPAKNEKVTSLRDLLKSLYGK